ncbi:MAG: hypothetical protein P9L99_20745 [Candidatus Lernaella stagnicola]|nr:hypothetical protein [Candidatus Lernaella stagnicola]
MTQPHAATAPTAPTALDYVRRLLQLLGRHRKPVGVVFGVVFVVSLAYALFGPRYYASSAVVMAQQDNSLNMLSQTDVMPISALASLSGQGDVLNLKILNILRSRDLAEMVIADTDYLQRYFYEDEWDAEKKEWSEGFEPNMEKAARHFREQVLFSEQDKVMGKLVVRAVMPDRDAAVAVAESTLTNLQKALSQKINARASETRRFITTRLTSVDAELGDAVDKLKRFQIKHQIYVPEEQIAKTLELLTTLEAERAANEIKMGILAKYAAASHPQIKMLQDRNDVIREKIDELRLAQRDGGATLLPNLETMPDLLQTFNELQRDIMVLNKLYGLLQAEFEFAKLKELKADLSFIVIDRPKRPIRKLKPRISITMIFGCLIGVLAALAVAFFREYYRPVMDWVKDSLSEARPD